MQRISILDSHTGGEPTRLVLDGGPDLGTGSLAERRRRFRDHHDDFRAAVANEPRGSEVMVGALLCPPTDPSCAAGVIFFNNVGVLNMCGHGTIGLLVSLHHLGRLGLGEHRIETPVGVVTATLETPHRVRLRNVPSWRSRAGVRVEAEGGPVTGDVAWGGNWFFLVADHGERIAPDNLRRLTARAEAIRLGLQAAGITGDDGGEIDHVELFAPSPTPGVQARNFVLCPGLAFDRSPCGTGTSAKVACLAAEGKLRPGETWRLESVIGSVFEARYTVENGVILPEVTGEAHVCGEGTLLLDPQDPFRTGIRFRAGAE
jgi:4-hydroxyproline epimerase